MKQIEQPFWRYTAYAVIMNIVIFEVCRLDLWIVVITALLTSIAVAVLSVWKEQELHGK